MRPFRVHHIDGHQQIVKASCHSHARKVGANLHPQSPVNRVTKKI
jgi:hypothetical protein